MRAVASCKLFKTTITPHQTHKTNVYRKISTSNPSHKQKSLKPQQHDILTTCLRKPQILRHFCTTAPLETKDEQPLSLEPTNTTTESSTEQQQSSLNQQTQSEQATKVEHVVDEAWVEKIKNLNENVTAEDLTKLFDELKNSNAKIGLSEYEKLANLSFKRTYPRSDDLMFLLDHAKQNYVDLPSEVVGKCLVGHSYSKLATSTNILGRVSVLKMNNIEPHQLCHEAVIRAYCGEKDTDAIKKYLAENELVIQDPHLKLAVAVSNLVQASFKKEEFTEDLEPIKNSLKESFWEEMLTELTIKHSSPRLILQFRETMAKEQLGVSFKHVRQLLKYLNDTKQNDTWINLFITQLELHIRATQEQMDNYLHKLDNMWKNKQRISHAPTILAALQNHLIEMTDEAFMEKMVKYFGKWNQMDVAKFLIDQFLVLMKKRPGTSFQKSVLVAFHQDSDADAAFYYWNRLPNDEASQLRSLLTDIMIDVADVPQLERYAQTLETKPYPTLSDRSMIYQRLVTLTAKRKDMKNLPQFLTKLQELAMNIPVDLCAVVIPVLVKNAEWKLASQIVDDLKSQVGHKEFNPRLAMQESKPEGTEETETLTEENNAEEQLISKMKQRLDSIFDKHTMLSPEDTTVAFNTILFRELYFPKDIDWKHTLAQMVDRKIPIALSSFNEILRFCLKKKVPMEQTWQYYDMMQNQGVTPDVDTFSLIRAMTRSLPNFFWSIPITIRDKLRVQEKLSPGEVAKLAKGLEKARNDMEIAKLKQHEQEMSLEEETEQEEGHETAETTTQGEAQSTTTEEAQQTGEEGTKVTQEDKPAESVDETPTAEAQESSTTTTETSTTTETASQTNTESIPSVQPAETPSVTENATATESASQTTEVNPSTATEASSTETPSEQK